jgi:GR25 family glycosyltransferase involved in LPS biosynthesis
MKSQVKRVVFSVLKRILGIIWLVIISLKMRSSRGSFESERISVCVMHKDVGNHERNSNNKKVMSYFLENEFQVIDSLTYYAKDLQNAEQFLKDRFNVDVRYTKTKISNEVLLEFPYAPGSLGIYASFLDALHVFLKTSSEFLLVCEDDLRVEQRFKTSIKYLAPKLPESWEVLNLIDDPDAHKPFKYLMQRCLRPIVEIYTTSVSACYLLKRQTAERILNDINEHGVRVNLDWYLFNGNYLKIENQPIFESYQVSPFFPKFCGLINSYKRSTIL